MAEGGAGQAGPLPRCRLECVGRTGCGEGKASMESRCPGSHCSSPLPQSPDAPPAPDLHSEWRRRRHGDQHGRRRQVQGARPSAHPPGNRGWELRWGGLGQPGPRNAQQPASPAHVAVFRGRQPGPAQHPGTSCGRAARPAAPSRPPGPGKPRTAQPCSAGPAAASSRSPEGGTRP